MDRINERWNLTLIRFLVLYRHVGQLLKTGPETSSIGATYEAVVIEVDGIVERSRDMSLAGPVGLHLHL